MYTGIEVTSVSLGKHLDISNKKKILNIRGFLYHDSADRNAVNPRSGKKCKFSCWYDTAGRVGEIRIMPQFPVR
jgi:hypothetical protein